jgi:mannosyltransferase OCH1-like enzyme
MIECFKDQLLSFFKAADKEESVNLDEFLIANPNVFLGLQTALEKGTLEEKKEAEVLFLQILSLFSKDTVLRLLDYQQLERGFFLKSFKESMGWSSGEFNPLFYEDSSVKIARERFDLFSRKKGESSLDYSQAPLSFSIPPIIHFIWLGSILTDKVASVISSWRKYHPGWEIKIWTDDTVSAFCWTDIRSRKSFDEAKSFAEKADILRFEVLFQFGGIYSDTDVICLNSFHDLLGQDLNFFAGFEMNYIHPDYGDPFYIGTAVMGASKGSVLLKSCLALFKTEKEAPNERLIQRTGPGFVSRMVKRALFDSQEKILILPCGYFYPLPCDSKWVNSQRVIDSIREESLAIHLWDSSWYT